MQQLLRDLGGVAAARCDEGVGRRARHGLWRWHVAAGARGRAGWGDEPLGEQCCLWLLRLRHQWHSRGFGRKVSAQAVPGAIGSCCCCCRQCRCVAASAGLQHQQRCLGRPADGIATGTLLLRNRLQRAGAVFIREQRKRIPFALQLAKKLLRGRTRGEGAGTQAVGLAATARWRSVNCCAADAM